MNYHNITHDDMLNGPGLRVVLWVAGCDHYCHNCQNPETWNPEGGIPFDGDAKQELKHYLCKEYIAGLTFSGGDPLFFGNREEVTAIAREVKTYFPKKTVWCYTGHRWEDVKDLEVIKYIDVVVDGEYVEAERDVNLPWVGSKNQRIINVKQSLKQDRVVLINTED